MLAELCSTPVKTVQVKLWSTSVNTVKAELCFTSANTVKAELCSTFVKLQVLIIVPHHCWLCLQTAIDKESFMASISYSKEKII